MEMVIKKRVVGSGISPRKIQNHRIFKSQINVCFLHPVYHPDGGQNEATNPVLPELLALL